MARQRGIRSLLHSFAGRIVFGGAIIHIVLIPFLFTGVLLIVAQGYKEQFIQYVRHDASQFAEHLTEGSDPEHLQQHLDEIALSGRTVFGQLIFENGKVISAMANRTSANFEEDFYFGEHGDGIYYISLPVDLKGGGSATLRLGYDETSAREQIQNAYERGTVLAIGYILLSLLLVAVVIPQLTRPLRKLRDAAQKIAAGEASKQLQVKSGIYEILDLADDLERMRHELVARSQAIATREERIRAIMDNVVDGIITIDKNGFIESMNQAALQIFGYSQAEIAGANLDTLLDQPYFCEYNRHDQALSSIQVSLIGVTTHETVGRRKDGHAFAMEITIRELSHSADRLFIAIVRDITERKQAEAEIRALQEDLEQRVIKRTRELAALNRELEHQALHDALTELPNRLLLQDRLRQAILVAQREHHPLALLITDLDRFKEINDTLGHHYGDLVLQQVAARLRSGLRESDTIARLGGDEFAVLLPMIETEQDAINAARKLITIMEKPIILEDQSFHVGISVGVALYPVHGKDGSTLMRHADVAMYVAKRSTADYAIYDAGEDQHSISRLAMVSELRHAIEYKQLVVFYQPKIDLRSGRITGVEALVRWNHPQRGLLMPDEFIPLAEHTGLIRPLTFFVLDEAMHQTHLWQKAGINLKMAINLSARHLQDELLSSKVDSYIRQWDLRPELLEFEITESAIMANPLRAMDTLTRLSDMGVGLSIDDFGTGYSSLVYLKQLPVDEIKIDKSFVIDMLENNEDMVIVRATVDLAHNMGRRVVAEGVESEAVLNMLIKLGCDMAQGYHISRPVTASVLTGWLQKSQWQPQRSSGIG
jgi:diguanylate cyclase (GGDEF)-like protein/PAS domain S-box-containing protein